MIRRADIVERVQEWGLAEQVVEKDYVLGWVLWGIGSSIFSGGEPKGTTTSAPIRRHSFISDVITPTTTGSTSSSCRSFVQAANKVSSISSSLSIRATRTTPSGSCGWWSFHTSPRDAGSPAKLMNRVQGGRIASWSTVPYAARSTRWRRRSKFAWPYICRLRSLSRFTWSGRRLARYATRPSPSAPRRTERAGFLALRSPVVHSECRGPGGRPVWIALWHP